MDRVNRLVAQNLKVDLMKQVNQQKLNQLNLAVDSFICEMEYTINRSTNQLPGC
jgi:hypothetical protein